MHIARDRYDLTISTITASEEAQSVGAKPSNASGGCALALTKDTLDSRSEACVRADLTSLMTGGQEGLSGAIDGRCTASSLLYM